MCVSCVVYVCVCVCAWNISKIQYFRKKYMIGLLQNDVVNGVIDYSSSCYDRINWSMLISNGILKQHNMQYEISHMNIGISSESLRQFFWNALSKAFPSRQNNNIKYLRTSNMFFQEIRFKMQGFEISWFFGPSMQLIYIWLCNNTKHRVKLSLKE